MSYVLLRQFEDGATDRAPAMIEARLPGSRPPAPGSEVWARASEEQTFVFAADRH